MAVKGLGAFLSALAEAGFRGEVRQDPATRTVYATDNSIYELCPHAVVFPRELTDLNRIVRAARTSGLPLSARGGGTGTNGQSLTDGIVVDCSRHLDRIEEIDPDRRIAVVQPGVILERLNRAAGRHGLFFAPSVSTATRATLAGMAATDASGKGSRIHGRTSDHVLAMDVVLPDGSDWHAAPLDAETLAGVARRDDVPGRLHRTIRDAIVANRDEITRVFPDMNRGLTGYNLRDVWPDGGAFTLTKLLCGSEGTLALTKRLTLRLTDKPAMRRLLVLAYGNAISALADAQRLIPADPAAVEFIDDRIVALAKDDPVWTVIAGELGGAEGACGLLFLEIQGDSDAALDAQEARVDTLASASGDLLTTRWVRDPQRIAALWELRARCVGLLGRLDAARQGTAFVEDAAVPPQALASFVKGFREILDRHGLAYGMFGHADAGCVHVRPALDMRRVEDAVKIRPVSTEVAALAAAHGGLLWGEHGRGLRSAFGPDVFGPRLWSAICAIKAAADPEGLFNPGKIAGPDPAIRLPEVDAPAFRGTLDARISSADTHDFGKAVACNGNGQCFNRLPETVMCPSYKATGDRLLSPKGRAAMIRSWLRTEAAGSPAPELVAELKSSLDACLGCAACASECPVQVDIPEMRSRFYERYYQSRRRPLKDAALSMLERAAPALSAAPRLGNLATALARPALGRVGLVDLPRIAPAKGLHRSLSDLGPTSLILLEDSFTGTFDGKTVAGAVQLLEGLGYRVHCVRLGNSGKADFSRGRRARFAQAADNVRARINRLAALGPPILCLEPVIVDIYAKDSATLEPLEAFLARTLRKTPPIGRLPEQVPWVTLFPHCTETSGRRPVAENWKTVFSAFGRSLVVAESGCCGMAGYFGHERENLSMSQTLFEMHMRPQLSGEADEICATGFSCRCQWHRMTGVRLKHPTEILASWVR